jgi:hypothetical protein
VRAFKIKCKATAWQQIAFLAKPFLQLAGKLTDHQEAFADHGGIHH